MEINSSPILAGSLRATAPESRLNEVTPIPPVEPFNSLTEESSASSQGLLLPTDVESPIGADQAPIIFDAQGQVITSSGVETGSILDISV